jgi:hypothetical protein
MLADIIHAQHRVCRTNCFVSEWNIQVFALLEQDALLLGIEAYIQQCKCTKGNMLIAKIADFFISYTRFFLDVWILEDGADNLSAMSVTNYPLMLHNIPHYQRIHKLELCKQRNIPVIN